MRVSSLSLSEVYEALQGLALNKSPGLDGLPVEFYLTFWDMLGEDLVEVFNESFSKGCLPPSMHAGLITLLPKKGDRLLRKNWHPVSLLNVDYKLCARALAGRLLKVIHLVVAPDQTCGVPGRFIGENVAFLRDVSYLPLAVLPLDQEKAFDRVDWPFLFSTLKAMGFGPSFIKWVQLLYSNFRSVVFINGFTSRPFSVSRSEAGLSALSPALCLNNGSLGRQCAGQSCH